MTCACNACTPEITETPADIERQTIQGVVESVEDLTPDGLLDSPRRFLIKVKTEIGEIIEVTYTAYPPTPEEIPAPTLNFEGGEIQIGDWIVVSGQFDKNSNQIIVAKQADSIETFKQKP